MKFGRQYKLIIQSELEDIIIEPPLTIEFDIVRNVMAQANTMSLKIYNLQKSTRNKIFQDLFKIREKRKIVLQAGYEELSTIFVGEIRQAYSDRKGPNIITEIEAFDGGFDILNSYTNTSIKAGSNSKELINFLMGQFENLRRGEIGDFGTSYQRGVVLNGNTFELLRRETGDKIFVDLGKVYALNENEVITGQVPLINSDTGLLGVPLRRDSYLTVPMLFEPKILVGQVVEIFSKVQNQFNGQYKVIGIRHSATISEAICGEAKTILELLIGTKTIGKGFNLVKNDKIIPLNNTLKPSNIQQVYDYLVEYGSPPNTNITNNIRWDEMLKNYSKQGSVPSLEVLANLEGTAQTLQSYRDQYFPQSTIIITSGWRSAAYNGTIKGSAANSQHVLGKAVDFIFSNTSPKTVQATLAAIHPGGLGFGYDFTHIDTRKKKDRFYYAR